MKTQCAVTAAVLLFLSASQTVRADELMQNGSFEEPVVRARTPKEAGGDPVNGGVLSSWQSFNITSEPAGGTVSAGLTNEITHLGAQSFFIKFDNVSRSYQNVILQTALLPVIPSSSYHMGLWGRVDKKNPLTLGERPVYLKIQIEFFKDDGTTGTGEPQYRIQPLPGGKDRAPMFTADKWNEFFLDIPTPVDAAFMTLTLKFETSPTPGKANGIIYFDDFSIKGDPSPLKTPKPKPEENPDTAPASDSGTSN